MDKEMIDYLRYKNSLRSGAYYDTSDLKNYNGETWLQPLLSHPEIIEELHNIYFKDHIVSGCLKLENSKFKSASIKHHKDLGPILIARIGATYNSGERDIIFALSESSLTSLVGRFDDSDGLLDWYNQEFDKPYSISNCISYVLSQLNKGRVINGKSYDEVLLERKQRTTYFKYKAKIEELDEQKKKLQLESQEKIESMSRTIMEDNEDIAKKYPNLLNSHTM